LLANLREEIRQEIVGVGLVTVSVLAYLGLVSDGVGGSGEFVKRALHAVFGEGAFLVPGLVGLAGLLYILRQGHLLRGTRGLGWSMAVALALGWVHRAEPCVTGAEFYNVEFGLGGGLVGAAVTWVLRQAFGPVGRDVALGALSLVAFLLATDLSLVGLFTFVGTAVAGLTRWTARTGTRLVGSVQRERVRRRLMVEDRRRVRAAPGRAEGAPGPNTALGPGGGRGWSPAGRPAVGRGPASEAVGPVTGRLPGGRTVEALPPVLSPAGTRPDGRAGTSGAAGLSPVTGRPTQEGAAGTLSAGSVAGTAASGPGRGAGEVRRTYEQMSLTEDLLYELPSLTLLDPVSPGKGRRARQDLEEKSRLLEETLASFGVTGKVIEARRGPVVTRFEFQPAPGVKVARITALADDIALHMAAQGVRIEAPIPGKHAVGIEVPNLEVSTVSLREVLEDPEVKAHTGKLVFALGKEISGRSVTGDLGRLLHILIAGATGSGKSVCLNCILASLLFRAKPNELKLLLIDPKVVELSVYDGIPHLVAPVVTDPKKAAGCLRWAVKQMEDRYELFAAAGVRDIARYNALVTQWKGEGEGADLARGSGGPSRLPKVPRPEPLPYIVVVIDELADLMMVAPVDVEDAIWRLAQMARAAGIHLIVATQRPSVDVITGTIKANIPTRIAFAVASQVDSRTIIDAPGAEKLLGHGDMLYLPVGSTKPIRVQGAFVSDREIEALVGYVRSQGKPRYVPDILSVEESGDDKEDDVGDDLFEDAVRVVLETGQASISMIQRKLRVGYTRAGRLIDMMEERGIVGPFEGSKAREILMTWEQYRRSRDAARRVLEAPPATGHRPAEGPERRPAEGTDLGRGPRSVLGSQVRRPMADEDAESDG